jgi:hypothetical protein
MVSITIGRSTDSMINPYIIPELGDSKVSRLHAVIELREDGRSFIVDKSANGTSINGIKIPENIPVAVYPGDIVQCSSSVNFDWYRAYQTVRQIQKQKREQKKTQDIAPNPAIPIVSAPKAPSVEKPIIAPIQEKIVTPTIDVKENPKVQEQSQPKVQPQSIDSTKNIPPVNFAEQAKEMKEKFPPVKELKKPQSKIKEEPELLQPKKNKLVAAGYICAMYSFIFPILAGIAALVISGILYKRGDSKDASYQILLVVLLVSLGLFTGLADIMLIMNR